MIIKDGELREVNREWIAISPASGGNLRFGAEEKSLIDPARKE
jgi:hypothetical protein